MLILSCSVVQDKRIPAYVFRFPPCDDAGVTFKKIDSSRYLADHRPDSNSRVYVWICKQFEFGVPTHFAKFQSVKKNVPLLESRFSYRSNFKGTRKNHEFIPGGENIVMSCVSRGASKTLLIQQVVLSTEHILPGSLYACSYDEWCFDVGNYISVENYAVNIKFLQPNGPVAQFFRPSLEDTCWIPITYHYRSRPSIIWTHWSFYWFDCNDEMNCVKTFMWFIWNSFQAESFLKN